MTSVQRMADELITSIRDAVYTSIAESVEDDYEGQSSLKVWETVERKFGELVNIIILSHDIQQVLRRTVDDS